MLVKDEADIIEPVLRHLLTQVDHVIVADNGSTDGTFEILNAMRHEPGVELRADPELGYWQSRKTSALAYDAYVAGFDWVVPCDADEVWYAHERRLGDMLDGMPPDIQIVTAELYNHLPTLEDDETITNPLERIGWRQRERAPLPKVAARTSTDLVIEAGNHGARYKYGPGFRGAGALIRHYSWRTEAQYLRKIRNGERAYAATTLPEGTGAHWRAWEGKPDEAIVDHFNRWFVVAEPSSNDALIWDPAPVAAWR